MTEEEVDRLLQDVEDGIIDDSKLDDMIEMLNHEADRAGWQLAAEYNIRDTEIIDMLEDKLKLLELLYAVAYSAKVNYIDCFTTVKSWDVMIHNHLMEKKIVIPFHSGNRIKEDYGGGWVKEPQVGLHKWVVSFDLNSLYPSLIRHYNISPEMFRGKVDIPIDEFSLLDEVPEELTQIMHDNNVTVTPNRCMWSREHQGFLSEMMEIKYKERAMYKKKMLAKKEELEYVRNRIKEIESQR